MPDQRLEPLEKPFAAEIAPPGSKSLTNRALVLAALAGGNSTLSNVLFADDTRIMIDALLQLGFKLEIDETARTIGISGNNGRVPRSSAQLSCGNSGTSIRFLTALCALGRGEFVLDGLPRMRQRPIGDLIDRLRHLGVRSSYLQEPGFPPVQINADGLPGGLIQYGASQSSQFLSAILMIAPFARHEVHVDLTGPQTSWPYVAMTMQLMDLFNLTPELIRDPKTGEPKKIIIPLGHYHATDLMIEPDASNASYFLAAAAIHPGSTVKIPGLGKNSLQGDVTFAHVLRQMGAPTVISADSITVAGPEELEGITVDLSPMPDTAQTLAVVSLFAKGPTTIRGLHTLRVKETDRLAALSNELSRLGAVVQIESDSLHIEPPAQLEPAQIQTYDDHRMAMSFAIAATRSPGITILDSQCVSKTYPHFFEDLKLALTRGHR